MYDAKLCSKPKLPPLFGTGIFQHYNDEPNDEPMARPLARCDWYVVETQFAPYILCYDFKKPPRWRSQQRSQGFFLDEVLDTSDWWFLEVVARTAIKAVSTKKK